MNPPTTDIRRSSFMRPSSHTTTFNAGDLIPIFYDEVLASDSCRMEVGSVIRSQTPLHPVMDDAFLDTYFFFVPFRLVWEHWVNFMGENTLSSWVSDIEYIPPKVTAPAGGFAEKSIADYFGMPTKVSSIEVDAMRFRGYRLVWNEYFRSEAIQDPELVNLGDNETDPTIYGNLLKANKIFDLFTGALPAPQRGQAVSLPLVGDAPLVNGPMYANGAQFSLASSAASTGYTPIALYANDPLPGSLDGYFTGDMTLSETDTGQSSNYGNLYFYNTYADMSKVTSATVNQLRQAFAVQRLLEQDARGGGRYRSLIRTHFGASVPDATVQVPEYLGGMRQDLRTQEVLQTSSSDSVSPQGNTAAFSKTVNSGFVFEKSFTEPGMIIGVACVRQFHSYQQGIPRDALRKSRYDFYWPELANIGEVGVKNAEIYAQGNSQDAQIFGYQEPWYEYRYKNSYVSGEMRSNSANSLDIWHYADDYASLPVLSSSWLAETSAYIDRTLAVSSSVSDQFLADFHFYALWSRPLPLYSIPGLTGHY